MLWTFLKCLATFQGYHFLKREKIYQVKKTQNVFTLLLKQLQSSNITTFQIGAISSTLKLNNFIQAITAKLTPFFLKFIQNRPSLLSLICPCQILFFFFVRTFCVVKIQNFWSVLIQAECMFCLSTNQHVHEKCKFNFDYRQDIQHF